MRQGCVLITGSSKGLGAALAEIFAKNGYNVILSGRNAKDLKKVKEKVLKRGVQCVVVRGDLRSAQTLKRLSNEAKQRFISVLVNNAALPCPHLPLQKLSEAHIDDLMTTNLIAPIQLTRRIYAYFLKKRGGTIININSLSGLEIQELRSIYGASKWGLRGFTDIFRQEAKRSGVRVIGVYPSRIKTRRRYVYGMELEEAARQVFHIFKYSNKDELILDDRPKMRRGAR